jgi:hypothetical protein
MTFALELPFLLGTEGFWCYGFVADVVVGRDRVAAEQGDA